MSDYKNSHQPEAAADQHHELISLYREYSSNMTDLIKCTGCGRSTIAKYKQVKGTSALQCVMCNHRINPLAHTPLRRLRIPSSIFKALLKDQLNPPLAFRHPARLSETFQLSIPTLKNTLNRIRMMQRMAVETIQFSGNVRIGLTRLKPNGVGYAPSLSCEMQEKLSKFQWLLSIAEVDKSLPHKRCLYYFIEDYKGKHIINTIRKSVLSNSSLLFVPGELPPWVVDDLTEYFLILGESHRSSFETYKTIMEKLDTAKLRLKEQEIGYYLDAINFDCCFNTLDVESRMKLLFECLPLCGLKQYCDDEIRIAA